MTSRFNSRIAAGFARLKSQAGETVAIRRAEYTTEEVTAIVGSSRFEDASAEGLKVRVRIRDYLVDVADYVINGVAVEPQPGDEILQELDGQTRVFEISSPGSSEPPWRYSDSLQTRYRIHTREVPPDED